jgi:hypothetical protein
MVAMPSGKVLMSTTGMDTNFGAAEVEGVVEVFAAAVEEDAAEDAAEGVEAVSAD